MCIRDRYKEGSNVENAHLLSRPLMLVVGELDDNVAVSYTHLDVYKRQPVHLFGWKAFELYSESKWRTGTE